MRYTYSRWDGTQSSEGLDPDELMEALSDDLMSDGDLWNALQRVTRWGVQHQGEQVVPGLQTLLQRLRSVRQQELERHNLDSVMQDIQNQVADIIQTELDGLDRKLVEQQGGSEDPELREMLEGIVQRKRETLQSLPEDPAAAIDGLANYEFMVDQAREKFAALMETIQQQVLQRHFQNMQQTLQQMSGGELQDLKDMLRDLNRMLEQHASGDEPDFQRFKENHGHHFPGVESLDRLLEELQGQAARMESLLRSMSPEMQRSLEQTMRSVLRDEQLREELAHLAEVLESMPIAPTTHRDYLFSGSESLTLEEALDLMHRMHNMERLEQEMKLAQETGDLQRIDSEQVQDLMGGESYFAVERLKHLVDALEQAGYAERNDGSLVLTARGIRRIGQKALQDIFSHLNRDAFGNHPVSLQGGGGDRIDTSKLYEFGDAFLLDMNRTLMNSVHREGVGSPLNLAVSDFEVFRTEQLTQSATVLMLDMSRSMPLRGCFVAAKKVALALNSLIRTQFPRDRLYIVGFSDYARELRPETLHQLTWGDYVYGTNMQHGFLMARRLLGKHGSGNKQIILITDGEPTAHFEGDRVHFSYPPTYKTFQETLREVKRCTQEAIIINTFMLERSHYLADFVGQMTRINRGRAFFATPERLGDYILVDYVNNKRRAV